MPTLQDLLNWLSLRTKPIQPVQNKKQPSKQQRQWLLKKGEQIAKQMQSDHLTTSNDNTWVESRDPVVKATKIKNSHLSKRSIQGAKAYAALAKEHPVMNAVGMGLGALPFAVASAPFVAGAAEAAPTVASALAPGSTFWMNPLTQQMAASTLGGTAVDVASKATTGKTWGENVSDAVHQTTGFNPQDTFLGSVLADIINPGFFVPYGAVSSNTARAIEGISPINRAVKNYADNVERRAAETVMRTTPLFNPLPEAKRGLIGMWNGEIGGKQRLAHIANYVFTGRKVGPKGYYNSFAGFQPTNLANIVKNPTWTERLEAFRHPTGTSQAYSGFVDVNGQVPLMKERNDIIDAFLFGRDIDPSFGVKKLTIGESFGPHTEYVASKYATKAKDIPVYEMNTPEGIEVATPVGEWKGVENGLFDGGSGDFLNVAGHIGTKGITPEGTNVVMKQDIWKFNPEDYFSRWLQNKRPYEEMSPWKKKAAQFGLQEIDRLGTPIITRTKWDKWGWL